MTILLLGDLTGRSRVALRMLTFELEKRGHEVLMLPTRLYRLCDRPCTGGKAMPGCGRRAGTWRARRGGPDFGG